MIWRARILTARAIARRGVLLPFGAPISEQAGASVAAVDVENLSNKIVRQMAERGWTKQDILDTIQNGKTYDAINKRTGGAATEYVGSSGKFVVVDNTTREVLQVSGPGFSPNYLVK